MKKHKWILLTILVLFVFSIVPAHASSVTYESKVAGFTVEPLNEDLFENFKNLLPGDERNQTIMVDNQSPHTVRLYLQARPVAEEDVDFLSYFQLTVQQEAKQLSDDTAEVPGGLKERVLLGTFTKGQSTNLVVHLQTSVELPNRYQNYEGIVPWVFIVEIDDEKPPLPDTGMEGYRGLYTLSIVIGIGLLLKAGAPRKRRTL